MSAGHLRTGNLQQFQHARAQILYDLFHDDLTPAVGSFQVLIPAVGDPIGRCSSAPHAARVDDHLFLQHAARDIAELAVVGQQHQIWHCSSTSASSCRETR